VSWTTADAGAVRVTDDAGALLSSELNGSLETPTLDVRAAPYVHTVSADPAAASAVLAQRGGSNAVLQGPGGLNVDVTGLSTYPISTSGSYSYTVSANGVSRTAVFELTQPRPDIRSASMDVMPATVTADWPDRNLDGPYVIAATDLPVWRIQTGDPVVVLPKPLSWARTDDGVAGTILASETLYPGSNVVSATFVPPNGNYSPASVSANWRVTVPVTLAASNAQLSVDGTPVASGSTFRVLPGATRTFAANPNPDFDWGTDWSSTPAIWSGSSELLAAPTAATFSVRIPAGTGALTLSASAYQLGPRVTAFSPVASSFTVPAGPAAGRSYPRSWMAGGTWFAYLGRDGVAFDVVGQARESGISDFEIQAKPPGQDWYSLTAGAPAPNSANGPRVSVKQSFSVKLGASNPQKPLLPADVSLAGGWLVRARVRSTAGVWSAWSFEQPLSVVMPVQSVTKQGRTLPPLDDADWFTPSKEQAYGFNVLVP
jgi:hypothetical protein